MNKSFNKIILSTVAMIPMGGIALKDLSSSGINFNYEARDCGGTTIEHKNVDLNPSSSQQLDDTYDKFNSTSDKTKYEKVWSTSGHKNEDGTYEDPGSSFGAGNTYSKTFDLANMLDSENNSWVSEVRINTSERFDFYRTIQLTDHDIFSKPDPYTSGRFWSSVGMTNEDINSNVPRNHTYTNWNEMCEPQKAEQAPYIGTGVDMPDNEDYIKIEPGQTKTLVTIENSGSSGVPTEYYNKYDRGNQPDCGKDGFINEISQVITANLDYDNKLTFNVIFGNKDLNKSRTLDRNRTKLYAIHLPKIDFTETSNSLPEGINSNTDNIAHEQKDVDVHNERVKLDFDPDDVIINQDVHKHIKKVVTTVNDSGYGTTTETTEWNLYPDHSASHYDPIRGEYVIEWLPAVYYDNNNNNNNNNKNTSWTNYYYSYSGHLTYSRSYEQPGGIYDYGNLVNDNYTKEEFASDIKSALISYNNKDAGVWSGIYTLQSTYSDLEYAIKTFGDYKNVPLDPYVDIDFYEDGNLVTDESSNLDDGHFSVVFKGNGTSDCIKGQTDKIDISVPFLDDFEIILEQGKSKSGFDPYYDLNIDDNAEEGEHSFILDTNADLTIRFLSKDNSFHDVGDHFETIEGYKTLTTNYNEQDNSPFGEEHPKSYYQFISEGIEYKLIIKNNSSSLFIPSTIKHAFTIKDKENDVNYYKGILDDENNIKRNVIVADTESEVAIEKVDTLLLNHRNHYIKSATKSDDGKKVFVETQNDEILTWELLNMNEYYERGGPYLESEEGNNQIEAAYERGALEKEDADPIVLMNNIDAININEDYVKFSEEDNVGDLVKEPLVQYYIKSELEKYYDEFNLASGETSISKYEDILGFAIYKGLLPFSKDENGNIINPYEWSAKVVAINGEESFNPETTLINNGDIISIEFTHNRTIDPNATIYGDGIMDMEVKF